jgi:hypothetical protein
MTDLPPTSAFEADILEAISAGRTMPELLGTPGWTPAEIDATLRRHHLVPTRTGGIVRADVDLHELLAAAVQSTSELVHQAATEASVRLLELGRLLGQEHAAGRAVDVRQRQCEAMRSWLDWLGRAEAEALAELDRLAGPEARGDAA